MFFYFYWWQYGCHCPFTVLLWWQYKCHCLFAFQEYLRDEDIEKELERLFGLPDDPDDSVDEYEGEDDVETCLDVRAALEDCNIFQDRESPTPGPSRRSPVSFVSSRDSEIIENIDPNIGVFNIEHSDEEILRTVRPSQVLPRNILESSSEASADSSSDDEDDNDWKKGGLWPDRPNADKYDEVTLKPKVFFPSRTSPMAYFFSRSN